MVRNGSVCVESAYSRSSPEALLAMTMTPPAIRSTVCGLPPGTACHTTFLESRRSMPTQPPDAATSTTGPYARVLRIREVVHTVPAPPGAFHRHFTAPAVAQSASWSKAMMSFVVCSVVTTR
jgi:hypothetical protein